MKVPNAEEAVVPRAKVISAQRDSFSRKAEGGFFSAVWLCRRGLAGIGRGAQEAR